MTEWISYHPYTPMRLTSSPRASASLINAAASARPVIAIAISIVNRSTTASSCINCTGSSDS